VNIFVNPQAHLPIYAQIKEQISELIQSGQLTPGSSLPSVRQLAEDLSINSLTIQKAYKGLQAEGLIRIKKGVGAFVDDDIKPIEHHEKSILIQQQLSKVIRKAQMLNISHQNFNKMVDIQWEEKE
jgi:GntR family transcriptional regulator